MSQSGVDLIRAERIRQVYAEGHKHAKDVGRELDLTKAGVAYAMYVVALDEFGLLFSDEEVNWPWAPEMWKPTDDVVRNLVKAGALIAAAIDAYTTAASTEVAPAVGLADGAAE